MSTARRLIIHEVSRFPSSDRNDTLAFEDGVNVLVGVPNTGKSKWLRMIDFILGDDGKPADVFGEELAGKYTSIQAVVTAGERRMVLLRQWDDPKVTTKIRVNEEWMTLHSFTLRLLDALSIPVLHYPQGNPYGVRSWPELGWRSLIRHVYRRQGFWSDLADRQPESEQHACLLQFVGIAERLFSKEYGDLVTLEKRIQRLQSDRERFVETLQEVSRDLIDEKELGVALTPGSISEAIARQEAEIASLQTRRKALVQGALAASTVNSATDGAGKAGGSTAELGELLAAARARRAALQTSERKALGRLSELVSYREVVDAELGRLRRAAEASTLLADLKITHCPACDRPISKPDEPLNHCYLCKRPNDHPVQGGAEDRLNFELQQLQGEFDEANELIGRVNAEIGKLGAEEVNAAAEVENLENKLRPATEAVTAVLPPELFVLDQEIGGRRERIAQLHRVASTLARREALASEIEKIQLQVADLESTVAQQSKLISFEQASDDLTDGMNTYLNDINTRRTNPKPWTQAGVDFRLRERGFNIRVGKSDWHVKLGGTLTLYFLIAYHYSLLLLMEKPGAHFPGLCLLDFPPELDGVSVSDSENFVLEPFVSLIAHKGVKAQVVAAGSSFSGLDGANRISLTTVWT